MTKAQEIHRLEAFIASLPNDTYLRPWLAAVLPEVRDALQQDILPQETVLGPAACYEAIAKAREEANSIIANATRLSRDMMEQARRDAQEFRSQTKSNTAAKLREIANKVESLVL